MTAKWLPAEVPVLVMVTPVNEFSPACVPHTFRIREDAGPHTLLGAVVGTDKDYPHNGIEYDISGGPTAFSVDRVSGTRTPGLGGRGGTRVDCRLGAPLLGEVHLLGSLDYELQKLYRLTVLVTDQSQDQDPTHRRSGSCTITIEVEVIEPRGLGKTWKVFRSSSGILLFYTGLKFPPLVGWREVVPHNGNLWNPFSDF